MQRCPAKVSEKKGQPWKQEASFLSQACHPLLQAWNGSNFNHCRQSHWGFPTTSATTAAISNGDKVVSLYVQSELCDENCWSLTLVNEVEKVKFSPFLLIKQVSVINTFLPSS